MRWRCSGVRLDSAKGLVNTLIRRSADRRELFPGVGVILGKTLAWLHGLRAHRSTSRLRQRRSLRQQGPHHRHLPGPASVLLFLRPPRPPHFGIEIGQGDDVRMELRQVAGQVLDRAGGRLCCRDGLPAASRCDAAGEYADEVVEKCWCRSHLGEVEDLASTVRIDEGHLPHRVVDQGRAGVLRGRQRRRCRRAHR